MLHFLLTDPLANLIEYGGILASAIALAWPNGDIASRKLCIWSAVAWFQANILYFVLGREHDPWIVPSVNAAITVAIAYIAIQHGSHAAKETIRLFILEALIVIGAFLLHHQGETMYYLSLNMVFLGRMSIIGGPRLVELVVGARGGGSRASHLLAGGP